MIPLNWCLLFEEDRKKLMNIGTKRSWDFLSKVAAANMEGGGRVIREVDSIMIGNSITKYFTITRFPSYFAWIYPSDPSCNTGDNSIDKSPNCFLLKDNPIIELATRVNKLNRQVYLLIVEVFCIITLSTGIEFNFLCRSIDIQYHQYHISIW